MKDEQTWQAPSSESTPLFALFIFLALCVGFLIGVLGSKITVVACIFYVFVGGGIAELYHRLYKTLKAKA